MGFEQWLYIYVARVSDRSLGGYWHYGYNYQIPFCTRYEEDLESFLKRHPDLCESVYKSLHSNDKGLVDFYQQSYRYIMK